MNKMQQLDMLFDTWKVKVKKSNKDYNDIFIQDGIVDLNVFEKQNVKVLFISNEANIGDDYNPNDDDIRTDFKTYNERKKDEYYNSKTTEWETSKGKLRERVCCLYQVIINNFEMKNTPYEVARNLAFMNLNKTGGDAAIDHRIENFCEEFYEEIKKEINIINPDLIVWLGCNTFNQKKYRDWLDIKNIQGKYFYNKTPVIRMWHTSYSRARGKQLGVFDDSITDKMAYKLSVELNNANLDF